MTIKNLINLSKTSVYLMVMIIFFTSCATRGNEFYVSQGGDDNNPGSSNQPFRSIQKAIENMQPGDVCYLREGIYREALVIPASGIPGEPLRIEAFRDEEVVFDGTEPVTGDWTKVEGNIYKTEVDVPFEQLFMGDMMMVEARWPNMKFPDQLWDRTCWAASGEGSRYGKMVDDKMAQTGIDWTGAIAVLNVAHQFRTWTRPVKTNGEGSKTFTYEKNLQPITHYADKTRQWEDDTYYLAGKLQALDMPGEWYLDRDQLVLYFWPPDSENPNDKDVKYKTREYSIKANGKEFFEIAGIDFFATTIRLEDVNNVTVEDCNFKYPGYAREFSDPDVKKDPAVTMMTGNNNVFRKNHISFSQTSGLIIRGEGNIVDNNLIHDVAWNGDGYALVVSSGEDADEKNVISNNTIYNSGYSVIRPDGKYEIKYNHLYNAALVSKDCAIIQTGGWDIAGSNIHHNWVHDVYATGNHPGGLKGGLGIRGDDQTRGLTVHHNVVWNCGRDGIIVKGDTNMVYNNTVFNIGSNNLEGNYISLHTEPEPYKPWRIQRPLLEVQNENSLIINNAAYNIVGDRSRGPFTPEKNLQTNYTDKNLGMNDPDNYDFSPVSDSPLVDAGSVIPDVLEDYEGDAPDIGAYEYDGEKWDAGINWEPGENK